jgi:hydrophobe/amphiphile efflux-1 (HAE1) family protein
MRNMSAWAIKNPLPPIVFFIVAMFMGIVAFIKLPVTLNPDVSFPGVQVSVSQPGAAPTEMENQVVQRIEASLSGVAGVRNISSRVVEGSAGIFVEFQIGTPIDRAVDDVRDAISKVRSDLPDDIQEPIVQRVEAEGGPIAYYSVGTTDMSLEQLSWYVDNTIARRLQAINGVAQVSRSGGVTREIRIDLDPARMQAIGITAAEVNNQLRSLNLDISGGRAQIGGAEQAVRVLGSQRSALALAETRLTLPGGRTVRLSDIASVRDGAQEIRSVSRLNGREVTSIAVFKSKGISDVTVFDKVEAELRKIEQENPKIKFSLNFTTVNFTKENYRSAMQALIEGSVLAVIVVWFFLRDWRATFISALAIPLSAIPAMWIMQQLGFTLNQISLLALSLVAGILVDDAIVEIENIVRHMRMGKTAYQAALEAADEIGLAVVATSATIIAVFLPVSFMGGFTGQYFKEFGLTVAAAVLMSLLVARLLTPVLAAFLLKSEGLPKPHADGPIMAWYLRVLKWSVINRWKTVGMGFAIAIGSIFLITLLPQTFVPEQDYGFSQANIELAPGARLEDTAAVAAKASAILRADPYVKEVFEDIGMNDSGEVRTATLYINLVKRNEREKSVKDWEREKIKKLEQIPDGRVFFQSQDGGGTGRDIGLFLAGDDPQLLEATAKKIEKEMQGMPELRDARINGDLQRPEIIIKPRLDLAADLGVSVASLSQTIRIATLGDVPQNLAKFSLADRQIPIRVSLAEAARTDLSILENLPVPTQSGATVPLKSVADISFGQGPSKIRRYNQARRVALEADLTKGHQMGDVMKKIDALPTMANLPDGVRKVTQGNAEFQQEMMSNFLLAIVSGVLMMMAVLVLLFARVLQPIVILLALPLSIGGVAIALFITGHAFSMPVVIGVLMLLGIVAKNSILLVDMAIEEMNKGADRMTAIMEAGHKRAQPIVMTTVAMVAGMLPIAIGWGADVSFRAPMAIAVIGGLITSTALTLVFTPACFSMFDGLERRIAKYTKRILTHDAGAKPVQTPAE